LPLVLPVFGGQYPQIEITLIEDTSSRLEQLTASGETDLSLLTLPLQEPSLAWEPLIEEEICLAVPPGHPLAGRTSPVPMRELAEEPFIVLKKGQGFRQITYNLCEQAGFSPRVVFESSNIETVQSLVAGGMGIAFVPKMLTRPQESEFAPAYLRLTEPEASRTLVIASRKGRYLSKAAEAFIETMKTTVARYYSL
jgi:DNA-binding transcriptional LysR family regulator